MLIRETKTLTLTFLKNEGFLRVVTKPIEDFDLSDARDANQAGSEMVNFMKTPVLIDSRNFTQYKKEINDFYASKEVAEKISALAIIVSSLSTRIVGNFFIKMHRPPYPTRLFTSDSEAANWLSKFIQSN